MDVGDPLAGYSGPKDEDDLSNLIKGAAQLKTNEEAKKRRWFDGLPAFVQNTLYHPEFLPKIKEARKLLPEERLKRAEDLKVYGNDLHKREKYDDAVDRYAQAAGVLRYVNNKEAGWREKGKIEDDILELVAPEDPPEIALVVACYLNIAACRLKTGGTGYPEAVRACDEVLALDASNMKALYRRAQARVEDPGAGRDAQDLAIVDLRAAAKLEPSNALVRKLLAEQIAKQKEYKKQEGNFRGMFDKAELYTGDHHVEPPKGPIPEWELLGNMPPGSVERANDRARRRREDEEQDERAGW